MGSDHESACVEERKHDNTDGVSNGTIYAEFTKISELTDKGKLSDSEIIEGLPCRLHISTDEVEGKKCLSLYIGVNDQSESRKWNVKLNSNMVLIHPGDGENHTLRLNNTFNSTTSTWGYKRFIGWDMLFEKGYVSEEDSITVEVEVFFAKMEGFRPDIRVDFSIASELADGILVVDDKKIHVSKQYLALNSPVFHAMFYQQFAEKDKKEIELKEVDYEEFIELLNVIYPSCYAVTSDNVEYLLKLADLYQIKIVIDRCERFLVETDKITVPEKLLLSDKYRLFRVEDHCLATFKKASEIKALKTKDEYKHLSDSAKVALFEKMMRLMS